MPRLLLILLVAAILLPAPQSAKETAVESSALLIRATPLALNASDPAQEQVGRLRYLGGWDLTSDHPVFGGLSSMVFAPDGGLLALSDSGELFGFDPRSEEHTSELQSLMRISYAVFCLKKKTTKLNK